MGYPRPKGHGLWGTGYAHEFTANQLGKQKNVWVRRESTVDNYWDQPPVLSSLPCWFHVSRKSRSRHVWPGQFPTHIQNVLKMNKLIPSVKLFLIMSQYFQWRSLSRMTEFESVVFERRRLGGVQACPVRSDTQQASKALA